MKFGDVVVHNFLTIRHAKVNLTDKGLHLIQGMNEDDSSASSNGAGKSSLVDAICWCLFALTAREVKGDAVVNLAAKKDTSVSVTVHHGATTYQINRYRKHATYKNQLVFGVVVGGVFSDMSKGTDAETQKLLERTLGYTYDLFKAAIYAGQEALPDLPKMKDKELKVLIEEAAGVQRIEAAYEAAKQKRLTAQKSFEVLSAKSDEQIRQVKAFDERLVEAKAKHEAFEASRGDSLKTVMDRLNVAKKAFDDATVTATEATEAKAIVKVRVDAIAVEIGKHKVLQDAATAADRIVVATEKAIDVSLLKRLKQDIEHWETRIANAETEVKKPCRECGTVLSTMSVEDFIAHAEKHAEKARDAYQAQREIATKQAAELKLRMLEAKAAREAVPDVSALIRERDSLLAEIATFDADIRALAIKSRDLEDAKAAVKLTEVMPNPHEESCKGLEKSLAETADLAHKTAKELEDCKRRLEVADAVVKVFGPAGVRAQILDTVTPFLNERTADYLSALSDGEIQAVWTTLTKSASGDYKEKFSLDVTHAKGGDSFLALSGGEKRKVRIATALALQDLVASRATHPVDLWIGDEIDDALDPAGLERLMTILERKARERGTVLVISHSDLRDWIDNVTIVRKTAQWSSSVEGSLCS